MKSLSRLLGNSTNTFIRSFDTYRTRTNVVQKALSFGKELSQNTPAKCWQWRLTVYSDVLNNNFPLTIFVNGQPMTILTTRGGGQFLYEFKGFPYIERNDKITYVSILDRPLTFQFEFDLLINENT